jgi:hypothetical protein
MQKLASALRAIGGKRQYPGVFRKVCGANYCRSHSLPLGKIRGRCHDDAPFEKTFAAPGANSAIAPMIKRQMMHLLPDATVGRPHHFSGQRMQAP